MTETLKQKLQYKLLSFAISTRDRIKSILVLLEDVYQHPREWWYLASPVWKCLLAGYVFVYISFIFSFEQPSSGSVLVLAALAADLLLPRTGLYRAYEEHSSYKGVHVTGDNPKNWNFRGIFLIPENENCRADKLVTENNITLMIPEPRPSLYKIATPFERGEEAKSVNSGWWQIHQTFERVQKIVSNCIVFSGIVGTAIWGYAHLFLP